MLGDYVEDPALNQVKQAFELKMPTHHVRILPDHRVLSYSGQASQFRLWNCSPLSS